MMEIQALKEQISIMAHIYGIALSDDALVSYAGSFDDLSTTAVIEALKRYRKVDRTGRFPVPGIIRAMVSPESNAETQGREIANRILSAVPKFGHNNGLEARQYIGEIGWGIVRGLGGWGYICEHLGLTLNPSTLMAQVRDMAIDQVRYGKSAIDESINSLPYQQRHGGHLPDGSKVLELVKIKEVPKIGQKS